MSNPDRERPKRSHNASEKIRDKNNVASSGLQFHRDARERAIAAEPASSNPPFAAASTSKPTETPSSIHLPSSTTSAAGKRKASPVTIEDSDDEDDDAHRVRKKANPTKKSRVLKSPEPPIDDDTLYHSDQETPGVSSVPVKERTKDVDHFFDKAEPGPGGKPRRRCKICVSKGSNQTLVSETTTLRRHMEIYHDSAYNKWAAKEKFESKLPKAVKARKNAKQAAEDARQTSIDPHLRGIPPKERVIPYSDKIFREAAVEWLVSTDQPIQALEHPSFQKMIHTAARATNGVTIPNRKATRREIIDTFKKNLTELRNRLNTDKVGMISLTCDAWQASNSDAYFAVTGHWNEELLNGDWEMQSALFGFTRMNTAHDGVRLGRALFKIVKRLKVEHKIGWVTCDNATNNATMLKHFERIMNRSPSRAGLKRWSFHKYHIRCLAHVINLATQALLAHSSSSPHYDPAAPTMHEPDLDAPHRDEVGLVRAITVKVRSSAKRKEKFLTIQIRDKQKSSTILLLDMKVRWSSTYVMLKRADENKKYVNEFIYEIAREEDDLQKRACIDALKLTEDEWKRVKLLIDLLRFSDITQQAFSYDHTPTLYAGLPALETLHRAWSSRAGKVKYESFAPGLNAAVQKIDEYYHKTATSHAYTFSMLLHPEMKLSYFKKHWGDDLAQEIRENAEKIFQERYVELNGNNPAPSVNRAAGTRRLADLDEDSSDDDNDTPARVPSNASIAPDNGKPWLREFNQYLDSIDEVLPTGTTVTRWWALNSARLPTWTSLAWDYLAIMGSSVSSERAFSSAGITISKRRNRLKPDIVEALQFLKSHYRRESIFREPAPSSVLEDQLEVVDKDGDLDWEDEEETTAAWDSFVINDDSDEDD